MYVDHICVYSIMCRAVFFYTSQQTKRPMPDVRAEEDPGSSIMNMMKNLYEEGDDEMKRTIAKAWTEANDKKLSGKHAGPDGGWGEDSLA